MLENKSILIIVTIKIINNHGSYVRIIIKFKAKNIGDTRSHAWLHHLSLSLNWLWEGAPGQSTFPKPTSKNRTGTIFEFARQLNDYCSNDQISFIKSHFQSLGRDDFLESILRRKWIKHCRVWACLLVEFLAHPNQVFKKWEEKRISRRY